MINPYICRQDKKLYFVLSEKNSEYTILPEVCDEVLIVINLYYLDTLERYLQYLNRIPRRIHVIVVSSVKELLKVTDEYIKKNNLENVQLYYKENRGRDISAFLVACRSEILKYTYFCFVHDKKSRLEEIDEETNIWIENLWNNTIINEKYISNVIGLFEKKKEIGLLVPPEPIGENRAHWFANNWGKNHENAVELLKKLNINCQIDPNIPIITLGTALWAKTEALYKLLKYDWKYEDFTDEPMPVDGTLSHAIERIFSFVVQEAGYETGTIMCNSYAEKLIAYVQSNMHKMFGILQKITSYSVENINDLNRITKVDDFCNRNKSIYLYGAGRVGVKCLQIMKSLNRIPDGFIVSQKDECELVENIPLIEFGEYDKKAESGIIITVGKLLVEEVEITLRKNGIDNYIVFVEL